jgi:hypothetical protein
MRSFRVVFRKLLRGCSNNESSEAYGDRQLEPAQKEVRIVGNYFLWTGLLRCRSTPISFPSFLCYCQTKKESAYGLFITLIID